MSEEGKRSALADLQAKRKFWIIEDDSYQFAIVPQIQNICGFGYDSRDQYRYFEQKTVLMQISTKNDDYIIDVQSTMLDDDDIFLLNEVFMDDSTIKVIHGCSQDVKYLMKDYDLRFRQVFDTEIAMWLLGYERS
ncbi:unnamed protein product, partial [Didymodactylos carnosus]